MELIRARVEIDYDDLKILSYYYPKDKEEPLIVEVDGQEYPAAINVENNGNIFTITINVCR